MPPLAYMKYRLVLIGFVAAMAATTGLVAKHKEAASGGVDLVLVLALDVSSSIDPGEYKLMTAGLASALASPQIEQAILAGKRGVIAICVVQWSGFVEQKLNITWTRLAHLADLQNLAAKITRMPRRYTGGATDIGTAIKFSRKLVLSAPFSAGRRVIDIAGDGTNNVNASPIFERDKTVKQGITINGLAITNQASDLYNYYTKSVIGGDGAFVEAALSYAGFERAMHRKLLREISSNHLY